MVLELEEDWFDDCERINLFLDSSLSSSSKIGERGGSGISGHYRTVPAKIT